MRSFTTSLALVAAASLASAQSVSCPAGDNAGRASNAQMYLASVDDIKAIVGNFQSAEWQGVTETNYTGAENAIGSTRTYTSGPYSVTEELTGIFSNSTAGTQTWKLNNGPFSIASGVSLTGYSQSLSVMPLCETGNSSQITWTTDFCFSGNTSDTQTVAALFTLPHAAALGNVTVLAGKGNFTACPSAANSTGAATSAASGKPMMTGSSADASSQTSTQPNGAGALAAGTSAALLAVAGVALLL